MRALALGLVLLGGCSDDVDLSGVYEVTLAVGSEPCGADQPLTIDPYLVFREEAIFGQEFFVYDGCSDPAGTECESVGGLFGGFYEPTDTGWSGETSYTFGGGGSCTLGYQFQSADRAGDALVIESSTYSEDDALGDDDCTTEEAKSRGTAMPCTEHVRIEARRLD